MPIRLTDISEAPTKSVRLTDIEEPKPRIPFSPGGAGFGVPVRGAVGESLIDKFGIPEIFQGIREMVVPTTPYTKEESDRMAGEIPKRLKLALTYYASLGGRLGPKGLREDLLRQAEELAGFGPALMPAAGETGTLAIEWGIIYPKLFKAAGMSQEAIGKIPRVAKATEAIKKMGGLDKLAEQFPRRYTQATNIIKAIEKGAGVGGVIAGAETLGKDMEPGEVLRHVGKRAALIGGVAGTFQAASEVDTSRYVKQLRTALIKASNAEFAGHLNKVDTMPIGPAKSASYKSLASLKQTELQNIDKIVSHAEAQLLGLKKGKLYQLGQEQIESPQKAAERLMKYGLEPGRPAPKGVEALEKGLGKIEPFIKMPMTRVAEFVETSRVALEATRHPIRAAEQAVAGKVPPTLPKPVTPPPVRLDAITETKQESRQRVQEEQERFEAEVTEMDRELAEIQRGTRETQAIRGRQAPELAPGAKEAAEAAKVPPTAEIEALSDKELAEKFLSADPMSTEWVATFKEMKRRKIEPEAVKPPVEAPKAKEAWKIEPQKYEQLAKVAKDYETAEEFEKAITEQYPRLIKQYKTQQEDWISFVGKYAQKYGQSYPILKGTERASELTVVINQAKKIKNLKMFWQAHAKKIWKMTKPEYAEYFNEIAPRKIRKEDYGHHLASIKKAISEGKPIPREVLLEYKSEKWAQEALAKPPAIAQNFTMFATEHGYPSDYDIMDHSMLSPSGKVSERTRKAAMERLEDRIAANKKAHEEYRQAILAGKIIDPSGEVTKERLLARQKDREAKEVEGRIAQIDAQIRFTRDTGKGKRGIKPTAQKRIGELEAEKAQLLAKPTPPIVEAEKPLPSPAEEVKKVVSEKVDLRQREVESEREATGISKQRRGRLLREAEKQIAEDDVYQIELEGVRARGAEIGVGYYYVPPNLRSEVEDIIGKPKKGKFKTKLQRMFTFDKTDTRIVDTPEGKTEIRPTPWDIVVQEALGRGREGIEETAGTMDISEFVGRVKEASEHRKKVLDSTALERARISNNPYTQLMIQRRDMISEGASANEIDEMISAWAEHYGVEEAAVENLFVGPEALRLKEIKDLSEADQDAALEVLARQNVLRKERDAAKQAVNEVLKANELDVAVEQIEEIRKQADLLGRPLLEGGVAGKQRALGELGLEFRPVEKKEPDQIEMFDDVPFEVQRGRPTGAAITTPAGDQIVLLAYGADSATGYHEAYHILRRLLTDKDRRILDKHFKGDEEAEASAFAVFAKTGKAARSYLRSIWEKLLRILRKIKSALQGRGYRTVDDIFAGIRAGTIEKIPAKAGIAYETTGDKWRREAERKAQINAEKARLKARITPKKKMPALKRLKIKIDETVTPILSRELGREPGGMKKPPPQRGKVLSDVEATQFLRDDLETPVVIPAQPLTKVRKGVPTPRLTQQWFDFHTDDESKHILGRVSQETKEIAEKAERLIGKSSTELYNVHPELFRRIREYEARWMRRTANMLGVVEPFLKKFHRLKRTNTRDYKQLDKALKNSAAWKVDQLVRKHNMEVEYRAAREVYEELYYGAKQVGMDMQYRGDYWHREVKNTKGFIEHFYQTEQWSPISQALKTRAARGGREVGDLTDDEKAQVINTLLRGYQTQAVQLLRPGATKVRLVPEVDKSINQYYYDSGSALVRYIRQMNQAIAQREFFGRETRAVQKLRGQLSRRLTRLIKYKNHEGLREGATVEDYKEAIKRMDEAVKASEARLERLGARDLTKTIGGYVNKLKDHGYITPLQEGRVQKVISGILQPAKMGKILTSAKTLIYLDVLNSFFPALTQLDEFAYAWQISPRSSIPAAMKTILRRNPVTLRDIGVVSIGIEFQEASLKRALATMLKYTPFTAADIFGKETLINTALKEYQRQARKKNLSPKFVRMMVRYFGPKQYKQVIEDLKKPIERADDIGLSDNIAFLLFNVAADRQPIAHSEMPVPYNTSGNGRIFYTLRTFNLARLNHVRQECFEDMKHPKTFLRGFSTLIWIVATWALMGAGVDALKDFIKGKPIKFADYVWDNLFKMILMSKYSLYKAKSEGIGPAAAKELAPPTKVLDAAVKDILNKARGKDRGFELWRSVPLGGEPYYWWLGEGRRKTEAKGKKSPVD